MSKIMPQERYPLFGPFLTLFGKNCVNKGTLKGVSVGDQVPHLCPQSPEPHVTVIMPQKRVGVTLGAQVRHIPTGVK